jgi:hypothetical protein
MCNYQCGKSAPTSKSLPVPAYFRDQLCPAGIRLLNSGAGESPSMHAHHAAVRMIAERGSPNRLPARLRRFSPRDYWDKHVAVSPGTAAPAAAARIAARMSSSAMSSTRNPLARPAARRRRSHRRRTWWAQRITVCGESGLAGTGQLRSRRESRAILEGSGGCRVAEIRKAGAGNTEAGDEVDLVLEGDHGMVIAFEIKAGIRIGSDDLRGRRPL